MKIVLISILFLFICKNSFADTLLVHKNNKRMDRIVLFDGKYWMHIWLTEVDKEEYYINFNGGRFTSNTDGTITLNAGTNFVDSLTTKYFIWPPNRLGPDFPPNFIENCKLFFPDNFNIVNIQGSIHWSYICIPSKSHYIIKRKKGFKRLGKYLIPTS